jgi:predicted alpha/beta hydrolase family esterase
MKKAVILHGTDGNPGHNWFPWLKSKLESEGYEVWVPLLPQNHTPNRTAYNDFLFSQGWNFEDDIIIGHSSGAVSVLNLLMDERCPKIKFGVLLGAWAGGVPNGYEEGNQQFINLFPPDGFDFELIMSKAGKLAFLHGDNDPYCPLEQAKFLAKNLNAPLTVVPNGHHLGSKFKELPELWSILKPAL